MRGGNSGFYVTLAHRFKRTGRQKTCGAGIVTSYNPIDGSVIWQLSGMQSAFSGSPAFDGDRIFIGNSGPMKRWSARGPWTPVRLVTWPLDNNFDPSWPRIQIAWYQYDRGPLLVDSHDRWRYADSAWRGKTLLHTRVAGCFCSEH